MRTHTTHNLLLYFERSLANEMRSTHKTDRKTVGMSVLFLWILVILFVFPACDLFSGSEDANQVTLAALEATQTGLAQALADLTRTAIEAQLTTSPSSLLTPTPTLGTEAPTEKLVPTAIPITIEPDERLMKSAKILLFEDMSASKHIRYVKEALDRAGYFYLDVGSAKGWFKSQLLSDVEWDLVIAAAEARRIFGGEFFDYIDDKIVQGAGAIIEYYDVDAAPYGKIKPFLDRCGIEFQADWYEPELRVFFWLAPDHPIFNEPNEIPNTLRNVERLWMGDVGDLIKLKYLSGQPAGDAVLLAGTNASWKTDHGTLVSCLGGRVILQTFGSHEYHHGDIVPLWQNYVYQALKSHFAVAQVSIPTPAVTVLPTEPQLPTPPVGTPGPAYGYEYSCGGLLTAQVLEAPLFQKDLFEHHAEGTFLIIRLELANQTSYPIFIWDQDYFIEADLDGRQVTYSPDKAATGFLYIENSGNLYQGMIEPVPPFKTNLAFDVDPNGKNWVLVVKPGSEFDEQVCEVRIPLYR